MLLKRNKRDLTALINGLTISALSAAIMFGAVGMYRLTSSPTHSQRAANEENVEKAKLTDENDPEESDGPPLISR